jgi:DNA polymerase-3 subunit delta'
MKFAFSRTQGLEEAKSFVSRALDSGKFPHALLIHGPEGVGQNPLLLDLVDILLCESAELRPCGTCAGCLGRKRNNLDNLNFVIPLAEKSDDGDARKMTPAQTQELADGIESLSEDPYGFTVAEKAVIRISQISDLQGKIAFSQAGERVKLVVMLKVETMDAPVANALLKTLEEPPPNTYFLLSSDDRSALLPTILSRCTQLPVFSMSPEALRTAIAAKAGAWDMKVPPEKLIPFAEGSPGVLLRLHRNGGDTLLEEAGRFLSASLDGSWLAFSDYLEESDGFADLQSSARLLHFLLRAIRVHHRLEALEGPFTGAAAGPGSGGAPDAETALRGAMIRQGMETSLAAILAPLNGIDAAAFTAWIEELLSAVQSYAKPKVAALGLYLDYAAKHPRKETQPC